MGFLKFDTHADIDKSGFWQLPSVSYIMMLMAEKRCTGNFMPVSVENAL